jgi:hypothetical protein
MGTETGNETDAVAGKSLSPAGTTMDSEAGIKLDNGIQTAKADAGTEVGCKTDMLSGTAKVPAGSEIVCVAGMDQIAEASKPDTVPSAVEGVVIVSDVDTSGVPTETEAIMELGTETAVET